MRHDQAREGNQIPDKDKLPQAATDPQEVVGPMQVRSDQKNTTGWTVYNPYMHVCVFLTMEIAV